MNASELHALVEYTNDVWFGTLKYDDGEWLLIDSWLYIKPGEAELILEALYARATGCGTDERTDGTFWAFDADDRNEQTNYRSKSQPSRLAALVEAYRTEKRP